MEATAPYTRAHHEANIDRLVPEIAQAMDEWMGRDREDWRASNSAAGRLQSARCEAWIDGKASVLCNRLLPCPMHSGEPARGNSDEEVCPVCEGTGYTDGVTVRHPCSEGADPQRYSSAAASDAWEAFCADLLVMGFDQAVTAAETRDRAEAEANVTLAARLALTRAAPAMLAALEAVVAVADRDTVEFRAARAAIAAARAAERAGDR